MPYKDKVLQREAVRKAVRKHRGITKQQDNVIPVVIPFNLKPFSKDEQVKVLMTKVQASIKEKKWRELQSTL